MLELVAIGPVLTSQAGLDSVAPSAGASQAAPAGSGSAAQISPPADLNAQVGIVVIQYRNTTGDVEFTIPSRQQLDAYAAATVQDVGGDEGTTA